MERPVRRNRRAVAGVVLLGLALVMGACTSSTTSTGSGESTTTTSESPGTTTSGSGLSLEEIEEIATSALLTAAEVGPGFVEMPYTVESVDAPSPCGTIRAGKVVEPDVQVGMQADAADGQVSILEEILYFESPEDAQEFYRLASAGLDCNEGTVPGENGQEMTLTISDPVDLSSDLPSVDAATGWTISSGAFESQAVAMVMSQLVVLLNFGNVVGFDTSTLPNPQVVTEAAIEKILAS